MHTDDAQVDRQTDRQTDRHKVSLMGSVLNTTPIHPLHCTWTPPPRRTNSHFSAKPRSNIPEKTEFWTLPPRLAVHLGPLCKWLHLKGAAPVLVLLRSLGMCLRVPHTAARVLVC